MGINFYVILIMLGITGYALFYCIIKCIFDNSEKILAIRREIREMKKEIKELKDLTASFEDDGR